MRILEPLFPFFSPAKQMSVCFHKGLHFLPDNTEGCLAGKKNMNVVIEHSVLVMFGSP